MLSRRVVAKRSVLASEGPPLPSAAGFPARDGSAGTSAFAGFAAPASTPTLFKPRTPAPFEDELSLNAVPRGQLFVLIAKLSAEVSFLPVESGRFEDCVAVHSCPGEVWFVGRSKTRVQAVAKATLAAAFGCENLASCSMVSQPFLYECLEPPAQPSWDSMPTSSTVLEIREPKQRRLEQSHALVAGSAALPPVPAPLVAGFAALEDSPALAAGSAALPPAPASVATGFAVLEDSPASPCECRGNCGRRKCKNAQNRAFRSAASTRICISNAEAGATFCRQCKCEIRACSRIRSNRNVGQGRWCLTHASAAKEIKLRKQYMNGFGVHTYRPEWPPLVRFVARFAPLFAPPDDLVECSELVFNFLSPAGFAAGHRNPEMALVLAFLGHALKWPPAVREWARRIREDWPQSPLEVVRHLRKVILFCHGRPWKRMFERMNTSKRMLAVVGVAILGSQLGMLEAIEHSMVGLVELGSALKRYRIVDEEKVPESLIRGFLEDAARHNPRWPSVGSAGSAASKDAILTWGEGLCAFAQAARSREADDMPGTRLVGGRSEQPGYQVSHFVRCGLYALEKSSGEEVLDAFTMQELNAFFPDERGHAEGMLHWHASSVREAFGTSPILLSGWLCLAGGGNAGGRLERSLLKPMVDVYRVFEDDRVQQEALEDPEEAFALGPSGLLDALGV